MDPLDHLHAHGYVVLRNVLTQDQVEWGVGAIRGGEVQYDRMRRFIDEHMMAAINEQMRWRVQYVKYRVSDNNNSADASTFHRDLMCKDADVAVPIPVFTCLTYFDATTMELIPNSHRELATGYWRAFRMFSERVQVTIHPGDLLVFYATLLHRGVFTDTQAKNRRLIQVFDSFANDADYQALAPRIVHVPGDETHSNMMIALSKRPWAIAPLNMYGYLNAATGYGGLQSPAHSTLAAAFYSSEGLRGRVTYVTEHPWQPINKYVVVKPMHDATVAEQRAFRWHFYERQFAGYTLIVVLFLVVIGLLIRRALRLRRH